MKVLSELGVGESARITSVSLTSAGASFARRLGDLGFTPGERVECVMSSPLGSMRAYLVRGAVIALRQCDAARVEVSVCP